MGSEVSRGQRFMIGGEEIRGDFKSSRLFVSYVATVVILYLTRGSLLTLPSRSTKVSGGPLFLLRLRMPGPRFGPQ